MMKTLEPQRPVVEDARPLPLPADRLVELEKALVALRTVVERQTREANQGLQERAAALLDAVKHHRSENARGSPRGQAFARLAMDGLAQARPRARADLRTLARLDGVMQELVERAWTYL